MKILQVRNVQEALPRAIELIQQTGVRRESRNGPVLFGGAVTTVYTHPWERVIFWPDRDANPFFHLYEALWMLQGRNDVAPLVRYVKRSTDYSDDGVTLHGAYGFRWRKAFGDVMDGCGLDQLEVIAEALTKNPDDRRCVLQMWDATMDLGRQGKDLPCNTIATFQRGPDGALNLTIFNRSNDIIWGAYGANAVQFSTLLEYMALWIGCPIGTYTQISVNWHAYLDTLEKVSRIRPDTFNYVYNPYVLTSEVARRVESVRMTHLEFGDLNKSIDTLLSWADAGCPVGTTIPLDRWSQMVYTMLWAHHVYKATPAKPDCYTKALAVLHTYSNQQADWIVAAREWLLRRIEKMLLAGELGHP